MIRSNLPELIVAALMTLSLFVAYAVTGSLTGAPAKPERPAASAVRPRYLLELRQPGKPPLRIENDGEWKPGRRLGETDLVDLRGYVTALKPDGAGRGPWSLRFYDRVDRHELRFDPRKPPPEVARLLTQMRLLQLI